MTRCGEKKRYKRDAAFWEGMFIVQPTQFHLQPAWLERTKQNNLSKSIWKESENSSRCGSFFSLQFKHTMACLFPQRRADLKIFHKLLLTAAQLVAGFQPSASIFTPRMQTAFFSYHSSGDRLKLNSTEQPGPLWASLGSCSAEVQQKRRQD